jgi:hypothetical protein
MNAAELMDRVFDVYKRSFFSQIGFSALVFLIMFVAIFVFGFIVSFLVIGVIAVLDADELTGIIAVVLLAGLVFLPFYLMFTAALSAGHILLSRQGFCQLRVKLPVNRLFSVLWRVVSASLAQIILLLPFVALCAWAFYGLVMSDYAYLYFYSETTAFFIMLGLVIIGMLVFSIYSNIFSLAIAVAVFERRIFFGTIARSWQLIKGEFWMILGVRVIWMLVVYLFSVSAQGVWMLAEALLSMSPAFMLMGTLVTFLVMMVISLVTMPLDGIFHALIYFNQRIKREALDIELCIEGLPR